MRSTQIDMCTSTAAKTGLSKTHDMMCRERQCPHLIPRTGFDVQSRWRGRWSQLLFEGNKVLLLWITSCNLQHMEYVIPAAPDDRHHLSLPLASSAWMSVHLRDRQRSTATTEPLIPLKSVHSCTQHARVLRFPPKFRNQAADFPQVKFRTKRD